MNVELITLMSDGREKRSNVSLTNCADKDHQSSPSAESDADRWLTSETVRSWRCVKERWHNLWIEEGSQYFKMEDRSPPCTLLLSFSWQKNICRDPLQPRISGSLIKHSHFTVGVCPNAQMRSLQRWNWACGDNASLVQWDVQTKKKKKKSNRFISAADEKQVGARLVGACCWIWNRTKPRVYIGPTAPRGRRDVDVQRRRREEEGETGEERREWGRCR